MKQLSFYFLLLATLFSCSSNLKEELVQEEEPIKSVEKEVNLPIDSTWNYYAGTAGMYDSQIIMELSFNTENITGSYWYSKHKKRLNLSGKFNEKDQIYEMTESYKGQITGRINFRIENQNLVGRWYPPKSTGEGESFFCEKIMSNSKDHLNPTFEEYKMDHKIEVYDGNSDENILEDVSDYFSIVSLNSKRFVFIYEVLGHNYHIGHIEGTGTFAAPRLGQFKGEEGCELKFEFFKDSVHVQEEENCDYYKGHRAYFGGTLVKNLK